MPTENISLCPGFLAFRLIAFVYC